MPAMRAAGYDYAELRVVDLRPDDDETVYAPIKRQIEDAGLPPEALNVFIPPHHPVVGPERDLESLRAYVTTAMGRMRDLGTRLVVFGSGGPVPRRRGSTITWCRGSCRTSCCWPGALPPITTWTW